MKFDYIKNYDRFINLVWVFFGIVIWLLYIIQSSVIEGGFLAICILGSAYPFTTYLSRNLLQKAIKQRKMLLFTGQFFLVTSLMAFFIPFILYGFLFLERSGVFSPSQLVINEDSYLYEYLNSFLVIIFVNFGFCGLRFYETHLKQQKVLIESQLTTLQAQITPHFMFNILNHIHVLMQSDVELSSSLLIKYSAILRYQLYSAKMELISMQQEVDFLINFVDVEMIRWSDKIDVSCSWDIEDKEKKIAPLLLITFIENAFKHVPRDGFERGFVNISLRQHKTNICLDVENSKSTVMTKKNTDSGLGLANTKQRLDILYSDRYELSIKETENTYHSKFTLEIE